MMWCVVYWDLFEPKCQASNTNLCQEKVQNFHMVPSQLGGEPGQPYKQ